MQTFLPVPNFELSAQILDYRRLGKQRVEAWQLLRGLKGEIQSGWMRHPAAKMWKGYEDALAHYMDVMIREWIKRGYNNTMKISGIIPHAYPLWIGDNKFHSSHRSNLLRKDNLYYGQFGWSEDPNQPYYWPVKS